MMGGKAQLEFFKEKQGSLLSQFSVVVHIFHLTQGTFPL